MRIDIKELFRKKNPGLIKIIPGFVFSWLKSIMHQDEINEILEGSKGVKDIDFARLVIQKMGAHLTSSGRENIPVSGGAIVASNHPLGGGDGMALMIECEKVRPDIRFIANDILMSIPNFETVFVPVNKVGSTSKDSLKRVDEEYAGGKLILIFPAGLCSRKQNGVIKDLNWNKSFISRAIKYQLPVVPTFISGENTNRFYRLANIRKFLGIKTNIEMFLLPDELFRQKGCKIHITFGKPIPHTVFDKKHSANSWAQCMKEYIYTMQSNDKLSFEEFALHHFHNTKS